MKEEPKTLDLELELHRLDWIQILYEAIKGRPTSWGKEPVTEWRNASDEVLFSLLHALQEKGIISAKPFSDKRMIYVDKEFLKQRKEELLIARERQKKEELMK
jgi:hypothetical protein